VIDNCGQCGGNDATLDCDGQCSGAFAAGTFSLSPNDGGFTLTASGDGWSVGSCENYQSSGGTNAPLAFSADCSVESDVYNGSVSLVLGLSEADESGAGINGTVSVSGNNFSATVNGSVADIASFPEISGVLDAFSAGGAVADACGICGGDATDAEGCD